MANLDPLKLEVAGLVRDESTPFEFRDAFKHIEEAAKTTTDDHVGELTTILSSFRGKISNLIILKPIRARAKDLADSLMLGSLEIRLAKINARNEALSKLTSELKVQIEKANSDANLLKEIKDGVDKATKTVEEAKSLVDQLTASDVSIKDKLKALIESLGKISSILHPQDT